MGAEMERPGKALAFGLFWQGYSLLAVTKGQSVLVKLCQMVWKRFCFEAQWYRLQIPAECRHRFLDFS